MQQQIKVLSRQVAALQINRQLQELRNQLDTLMVHACLKVESTRALDLDVDLHEPPMFDESDVDFDPDLSPIFEDEPLDSDQLTGEFKFDLDTSPLFDEEPEKYFVQLDNELMLAHFVDPVEELPALVLPSRVGDPPLDFSNTPFQLSDVPAAINGQYMYKRPHFNRCHDKTTALARIDATTRSSLFMLSHFHLTLIQLLFVVLSMLYAEITGVFSASIPCLHQEHPCHDFAIFVPASVDVFAGLVLLMGFMIGYSHNAPRILHVLYVPMIVTIAHGSLALFVEDLLVVFDWSHEFLLPTLRDDGFSLLLHRIKFYGTLVRLCVNAFFHHIVNNGRILVLSGELFRGLCRALFSALLRRAPLWLALLQHYLFFILWTHDVAHVSVFHGSAYDLYSLNGFYFG